MDSEIMSDAVFKSFNTHKPCTNASCKLLRPHYLLVIDDRRSVS